MQKHWLRLLALIALLAMTAAACAPAAEDEVAPPPDEPAEPDDDDVDVAPPPDDVFRIGYLLPQTGALAFLGPPMIAGVEMAVRDINDAGGVMGMPIELVEGDEAGDATVASTSVDRLLAEGVSAIIGAAASGMSLAVIDKITGAGIVQCSPSNTSPTFTTYDDDGFYFRAAPTDALQGPVLAETILGDGFSQVAVMARADDYGRGLATATVNALEEAGADVVAEIIYDPEAGTFDAEVSQVAAASPDAVALIAFEEGTRILTTLIEQGLGPADIGVYGADGLRSTELPSLVDPTDPSVLDGMKGTAPTSATNPDFIEELQAFRDIPDTLFGAESYDCVTSVALAATAAGSTDPRVFVGEMINVTRDGTTCTSYAECAELLEAGEDIDYDGASGPLDFTEAGEPARGVYEVWGIEDGELVTIDEIESTID